MLHMRALVVTIALATTGCSAVGVPESSNPNTKLNQAVELQKLGRFVPAQHLIQEALEISEQRSDQAGIAEAYRQFGLFYRAPIPKDRYVLLRDDFAGTTNGIESRYLKAMEYFERSLAILKKQERHDAESNAYYLIAQTQFVGLHDGHAACASFESSRAEHHLAVQADPKMQAIVLKDCQSFEEEIDVAEREIPCT